jgi:hypothetical protein
VVEVADVRRRFRARIEHAKRMAESRRVEADRARKDYDGFIEAVATPVFRMVASVLSAEGYPFKVFTPGGGVRLASATSRENYVELDLDTELQPPQIIGRVNRSRGGRVVTLERPVKEGRPIHEVTDEDLVAFLAEEMEPFL